MKNIAIIGNGGHANVVKETLDHFEEYSFKGFIGKNDDVNTKYNERELYKLKTDGISCLICGIGNISNVFLEDLIKKYEDIGFEFPYIIHPSAVVSNSSKLSKGTIVLENAVIKANSTIGEFCTINSLSLVSHDCVIGDYTHISLGAKMGGNCEIGKKSFLGINSSIIHGRKIGANVIVGAGAVVTKDIIDNAVVAGNPAKNI
jgi:acetyltransferase EpsM